MKSVIVAGARPNFMKVAPILWEMKRRPGVQPFLIHTGQHYSAQMSYLFFQELGIPRPDVNLGVGSASHAVQTAEVMKGVEPVLLAEQPDVVLVVGDVNSTLACALTAVKLGLPVAHVEAGLRSFDRTMPEEINRILTDTMSQWLFVSERTGLENLHREGVAGEQVFFVGNVMIDTLLACRERSQRSTIRKQLGVEDRAYAVLTLHRPANVDDPEAFGELMAALERLQRELTLVFPVHPRSRKASRRHPGREDSQHHSDRSFGVPGFRQLARQRPAGAHRFGGHSGRDHGPRCALPDSPEQHRTASDHRTRNESPGRDPGGEHRRGRPANPGQSSAPGTGS